MRERLLQLSFLKGVFRNVPMLNIYLYTIDALLESAHFDYNTTFLRSHKISWDLLRSPKIFWGIIRSTEISSINWFDILHLILIHDTWHLTLICFWHWYAVTFDNWYLTSMQNLSDCIVVSRTILMLLIALYCTHCRSLPFLCTLHSSQVMLWRLKHAERLPCFRTRKRNTSIASMTSN